MWTHGISGGLVLVLALGLCLCHWLRRGTSWTDYAYGAGTWTATVLAKLLLAVFLFGGLHTVFAGQIPLVVTMMASGLLTGATECAGTFLVARTNRWRRAKWNSVAAFGLAFGCFEAAVLSALLLLTVLAAQFPAHLEPPEAQAVREALSDPHRPLTFLVERAIAVPVHLLTSVLIIRAAQTGKMSLFWWGFLLKSLIDAVPAEELPVPLLEGIYTTAGLFSSVVFFHLNKKQELSCPSRPISA